MCAKSADIAFVMDASLREFELIQELAYKIAENLNIDSYRMRAGAITYQASATLHMTLGRHSGSHIGFLNAMRFTRDVTIDGTNAASAFHLLRNDFYSNSNGDRDTVANIVLWFTDGYSNIDRERTVPEAVLTRDHTMDSVRIITVGIGDDVNRAELEGMASQPASENIFYLPNVAELDQVAKDITAQLCN